MISELKNKYIGSRSFYKSVMAVAIPIMIQNGITNFVSMLDNIMVGRVGTEQMTGVAIVNQLIFVFNLAIFGAISGAGIFSAQFYGSGDHRGVRYTFRFKLIICALITAIGTAAFLLCGDELIMLYLKGEGTAEQIAASFGYAKEYMLIMLVGIVPFAASQCYSGTLRETGETVLPMKAGGASVSVNLMLNTLLIFGLCGFPALGAAGAAIATVISRFVEAAIVIIWTHSHKEKNKFIEGVYRGFGIPRSLIIETTKKSVPLLFNETMWSAGMAVLTQCYSLRGYNVVSAVNITSTITNVFGVSFMAMGNAIGIIIGQMLGAGEKEKAVESDRKLIAFSVFICTIAALVMSAAVPFFPMIYETSDDIRSLASGLMLMAAICMPINALANACYFTLRSGGKTFITILFDSCFVWVVTVPLAFVLSRFTGLPIIPLYFICQAIDIGKCVVGVWMIKRGIWINNIVAEHKSA